MISEIAHDSTVTAEDGTDVGLDSLWRDRPAVIAFVRHFG
jgi:hypothetical protein